MRGSALHKNHNYIINNFHIISLFILIFPCQDHNPLSAKYIRMKLEMYFDIYDGVHYKRTITLS